MPPAATAPARPRGAARKVAAKAASATPAGRALGAAKKAKAAGAAVKALPGKVPGPAAQGRLAPGKVNRWVLVEFLVCFTILGLGTIVAPSGQRAGGSVHLAVKGSGLALLFFIIALLSGGGPGSKKAAAGIGALVTAGYVFTSQDSVNLINWISGFFGTSGGSVAAAGAAAQMAEATGAGQAGAEGEGPVSAR